MTNKLSVQKNLKEKKVLQFANSGSLRTSKEEPAAEAGGPHGHTHLQVGRHAHHDLHATPREMLFYCARFGYRTCHVYASTVGPRQHGRRSAHSTRKQPHR